MARPRERASGSVLLSWKFGAINEYERFAFLVMEARFRLRRRLGAIAALEFFEIGIDVALPWPRTGRVRRADHGALVAVRGNARARHWRSRRGTTGLRRCHRRWCGLGLVPVSAIANLEKV